MKSELATKKMKKVNRSLSIAKEVKVYIAPLSPSAIIQDIMLYINHFQIPVKSVKIHQVRLQRSIIKFAIVKFDSPNPTSVNQFLHTDHFISGRRVFSEALEQDSDPIKVIESSFLRRVSILNVPMHMTINDLHSVFSHFGIVVSVYRERGYFPGQLLPSGFLLFAKQEMAEQCLEASHIFINQFNEYVHVVRYHGGHPAAGGEQEALEGWAKNVGFEAENLKVERSHSNKGEGGGDHSRNNLGDNENEEEGEKDSKGHPEEEALVGREIPQNEPMKQDAEKGEGQMKELSPEEMGKINKNRKRRLTRKVKKQLKFDNYRPWERGYWLASRNRTKILEKVDEENLRFNMPGKKDK